MIVDDFTAMLKIIRTILKGLGYTDIAEAKDDDEAWEKLQDGGVDLLITDWNMPNMSGLELVEKVRSNPPTSELPIIMSTSRNVKEDFIAAMKAGVNNYITKPYNPQQLEDKIGQVFKKIRAQAHKKLVAEAPKLDLGPLLNNAAAITMQDDFPFVTIVEKVVDATNLGRPENEDTGRFLNTAVKVLDKVNQQFPDVQVRYVLEDNTHAIMRMVRFHREHLKLLMISDDIVGGGLTLARLAALNQEASYKVCLICEMQSEFSAAQRDGMEKMGILLLERRKITDEVLEDVFKEYAIAAARETSDTLAVAPEEMKDRLEADISLTTELPVLPQVYNRIMKLARDPASSMADWAEAVETDPLSSAMIMRRARSPIYGFCDKVEDVKRAVTLIGKDAVKDLVASAALKSSFKGVKEKGFSIEDFWRHSAAVGLAARMLTLPFDGSDWDNDQQRFFDEWQPDDATVDKLKEFNLARFFELGDEEDPFVGGMMHDIGKVAMTCAYPGLWPLILQASARAKTKFRCATPKNS